MSARAQGAQSVRGRGSGARRRGAAVGEAGERQPLTFETLGLTLLQRARERCHKRRERGERGERWRGWVSTARGLAHRAPCSAD